MSRDDVWLRGFPNDTAGQARCVPRGVAGLDGAVSRAYTGGLGGVGRLAVDVKVERLSGPGVRVQDRHDHHWPEADVDLRRAELDVVGRDREVARDREPQPAAEGVTRDPGDDRLAEVAERGEQQERRAGFPRPARRPPPLPAARPTPA